MVLSLTLSQSLGSAPETANTAAFRSVLEWILATGKGTVIRSSVANAFGLGEKDVAVVERGFRRNPSSATHVIAVVADPRENISSAVVGILDERTGAGTFWHVSATGVLLRTAIVNLEGDVSLVPNDKFSGIYAGEKEVFRHKMLDELIQQERMSK